MSLNKLGLVPTIFTLVFIIKAASGHFEDPDFYWHIKTGEYIVSTGSLPHADIFSYTQSAKPWVLHEWLFQVLLYWVMAHGGLLGVSLMVATLYVACCFVTFRTVLPLLHGSEGKALIVTLLCSSLYMGVAPRPYLFTFLFFALFLNRLIACKYHGDRTGWWLILILMPLWVNLHGGYFIGIVLLGLFLFTEWLSAQAAGGLGEEERRNLVRLAGITMLGGLATLANPEFINHWWYPFQVIGMDASKGVIEEWRSPDFHQPLYFYFLAVVTMVVGIAFYSRRRLDLTEFALPAVFVVGAFVARRNFPLAAITLAPFLALQIKPAGARLAQSATATERPASNIMARAIHWLQASAVQAPELSPRAESFTNAWLILITLAVVVLQYPARQKEMADQMNKLIPVKATDFLVQNRIGGHMFNAYHYGGYLIYRLFPAQKVFIDGRADMYGDAFIHSTLEAYGGGVGWKRMLDRYQVDYVVCESESPIRQLLMEDKAFKLVFDDKMHSVLLKNIDKYRALINKYASRPAS